VAKEDNGDLSRTSTADWVQTETGISVERFCPKCERSFEEPLTRCPDDDVLLIVLGEETDPLSGKTIRGAFTLRERIGKGGMGVVYKAWQHSVGREVAVKVMSAKINQDPEAAKRFFREAKLASRLAHPNIVTVFDFGQDEDRLLYIVMEYLTGTTLREALERGEPFDLSRVRRMLFQLCDALEAAHEATIVHRDLKPANIVLLRKPGVRDFLKVLDFGIAKSFDGQHTRLTRSGAILGTPAYMPPEVALDGTSDARSDLYSLGVITYQMLSGRLPFAAEDVRTMIAMHTSEPPPPLGDHIPAGLVQVVNKLLAKDPEDRFQTAADVRTAVEAVTDSHPAINLNTGDIAGSIAMDETTPATPGALHHEAPTATTELETPEQVVDRTVDEPGRRWSLVPLLAVLVVVLGGGFVVLRLLGDESTPAPPTKHVAVPIDAAVQRSAPPDAAPTPTATPVETVRIHVTARRAKIYIDGKPYQGHASLTVDRGATIHYVRVVRKGYKEWATRVEADRDHDLHPKLQRLGRHHRKPPTSTHKKTETKPPPKHGSQVPWQ